MSDPYDYYNPPKANVLPTWSFPVPTLESTEQRIPQDPHLLEIEGVVYICLRKEKDVKTGEVHLVMKSVDDIIKASNTPVEVKIDVNEKTLKDYQEEITKAIKDSMCSKFTDGRTF